MNFLNSAFLVGLGAALIPLVIHLLNRRRLKTIDFSSVMFLRDLRRTRMRRLQLRRWLLLLVRTLLVAMAVLAFARPALKGGVFASLGSRARTTAVIAVDCSASMALETQNGTAHERALARVGEIAEFWGEGDEGIGLPFADSPPVQYDPPTADFDALADRLRESTAGYGATDAGAALTAALATLAQARNLNREIYMLSDFRREGFVQTVVESPAGDDGGEEITVYIVDVSEAGGFDLGVSNVALANQLIEPGSPFTVTASVTNHTDRPVDRLLVSIFLDGRRLAQAEAHVAASGTVTVEFHVSVETAGVHDGFVEISADDNARNNRRYFAFVIPEEIKVLLVSDYPSGRTAPALALAPISADSRRIAVTAIGTDQLIRENVFDYDCVVVSEWRVPDPTVVEQLLRYVRAGGGVFVAPSIDADTTAWNTLIAGPHFGLRMGPRPLPPSTDRYFIWERYDWNHPIWSVYGDVARDKIPEVRWHSVFRTEGTHSGATVVSFSGGRAALSEQRLASGKLLALWTPMGAAYTNLPLRSIFVPFMHRLVEYLSADLSERRSDFVIGEAISREPSRTLTAGTTLEIIAPDGTRLRPGLERVGARVRLTLDNPEIPGVYRVVIPTQDDAAIDAFSVNLDPMETAAAVISRDELKRRWSGANLVFVEQGQSLGSIVTQTRYGTEIRSSFLWAVVALFFFEMFLARTRRRDRPEATAAFASHVSAPASSH